ncbi:MAG: hypothetical protein HGA75_09865 [Thiobacillus sp.]|nr:hypothetical protein [Thiobacillus sp.]
MDRTDALAACDRALLRAFSRHTTERLNAYLPMRLALPWLDRFLALNVAKEVRKDSLVIRRAGQLAGPDADAATVRELLAVTREIDRDFLRQVAGMPFDIVIRYDEIEPIRRQRIERLIQATRHILAAWQTAPGARAALQAAYGRADLERLVLELMRLYARETQALSHSLRLPMLLSPLRDKLAHALYEVMTEAADGLARQAAGVAYRRTWLG